MYSRLRVMNAQLATTLLVDHLTDAGVPQIADRFDLDAAIRDADIVRAFTALRWHAEPYLVRGAVLSTTALTEWEVALIHAIAPALEAGSFLMWHDAATDQQRAIVVRDGQAVSLVEAQRGDT